MNIYIASFKEQDLFDYEVDIFDNADWWREYFKPGDVVKAGTILKVVGKVHTDHPDWIYDVSRLPAYLIAREDYTVDNNLNYDEETSNRQALHFGRWYHDDGRYYVDVINEQGEWYNKGYTASNSIWDTCTPNNQYANQLPWTFVTEGVITDYISFQWNDKYYEPGSFSLALPANNENMDVFQEGRYILNEESEHVMMIETVQFNSNLKSDGYIMTVSGRSIEAILERRIAFPGQGLNTNEYKGEDGMRKAIYDLITNFFIAPEKIAAESSDGTKFFYYPERRVPFIELPDGNNGAGTKDSYIKRPFRASINQTVAKDDLLKVISELCKNSNLGFKMLATPRYGDSRCITWKPILYTGEDKSYNRADKTKPLLLFSPTVGNVEAVATTKDITNYRNAIFCGVEKESDGYIDLTRNSSEANYFAQKTGVELVDSFNSNATKLITGVKETLVSKLEPSPVCYTGILFLAIAAARKDRDYTATVTKIERIGKQAFIYADVLGEPGDANYIPVTRDAPGYIKAYTSKDIDPEKAEYIIYIPIVLDIAKAKVGTRNEDVLFIAPVDGTTRDKIYLYWTPNTPEGESGPMQAIWIDCDIEYTYINGKAYGKLIPNLSYDVAFGEVSGGIPIYKAQYPESDVLTRMWTKVMTSDDTGSESITAYPSDYISKSEADNIVITYREAFGDVGEGGSSKTKTFILSKVNINCPGTGTDFKNSTAAGWLTTPILKQALSDLNNTTFSRLSTLKKSAIQAWFKTFDKYTSSQTQMRWLCQEYVSDAKSVGIDRREVFVEEDNSDSDDWNASKINQFQSSTVTISVNDEEDEESDEVVNERLLESARKRSGDYRKKRDIDASLELENYKYRSDAANGYDLGDIIQVDDGWGNLDQFIITGYTISVDTTSGPKRVPTFERYEPLPKAYRQLDWLQVANMILPVKFNKRYSGASVATELNLPANVYFGAKDSNKTIENDQNTQLSGLTRIWSESQNKITDIEGNLQYIQKTMPSGEEPSPLSPVFSLISAIGAQEHYGNGRNEERHTSIRIPFAIITTTLKSPLLFMSNIGNLETKPEYYGDTRYIYSYMANSINLNNEEYLFSYSYGGGYRNKYVNGTITESNIEDYIYRSVDDGSKHTIYANKLYEDHPQIMIDNNTKSDIADKTMYYARSFVDNDIMISNRPLSRSFYIGLLQKGNEEARKWLIDSSCVVDLNAAKFTDDNSNRRFITGITDQNIRPEVDHFYMDNSYWGQDNYRYPKVFLNPDDIHVDITTESVGENNIVVGGLGYYYWDNSKKDYKLHFDNFDAAGIENLPSPRGCDASNGVRIFNLKIYETDAATRYTQFGTSVESSEADKHDIAKILRIHKTWGDHSDDTDTSMYAEGAYDLAFYPDLTTRKLVHDYVPVVYLEGGDDILDTEKYGLFDLINQQFVPINFGDNEDATFIEAGGEIARE